MRRSIIFACALAGVVALGCGGDQDGAESGTTLALALVGADPLVNGYHYEGWAIIGGEAVTTGKFNIDGDGSIVDLDGNAIPRGEFDTGRELGDATAIVITIEPSGDVDTIPADTHYLAGGVVSGAATLSVGHGAALGDDFVGAGGKYILATPTNGGDTDENSGIWFLDLPSTGPAVGLDLPGLPAGWEYEGWVVVDGTPVTSGRFLVADEADFSAPHSGPQDGPPFPGEDYLENAPDGLTFPTDLAGDVAVISIEPSPDDSPGPFTLKPLVGAIPEDAVDHQVYLLDNNSGGFPSGSASVQ